MADGTERPSRWVPPTNLRDLAHLGKHVEELGECVAILGHVICQGIDGTNPDTGELNVRALEKEIADVAAMAKLTCDRFGLNKNEMNARAQRKIDMKRAWHDMLPDAVLDWQPIETAPRGNYDEGAYILLRGPSGYGTTPYRVQVGRWGGAFRPDRWITFDDTDFTDDGPLPTYWAPLPW